MNPIVAIVVAFVALGAIYLVIEATADLGAGIIDRIRHRLWWRRYQKRREARGLPRL